MPSHLDALQTTAPVNFRRGPGELHSVAKYALFHFAFQTDFGGFRRKWECFWEGLGDQNGRQNQFFGNVLSKCVSASIFGGFFKAPNLKNSNFVSTGARFSLNRRFRKSSEKKWMLASFSEAKT